MYWQEHINGRKSEPGGDKWYKIWDDSNVYYETYLDASGPILGMDTSRNDLVLFR